MKDTKAKITNPQFSPPVDDLRLVILNIELGFQLVKCPKSTQHCPVGLGQAK